MITNEKQFKSTKSLLEKLRDSQAANNSAAGSLPSELLQIQRDALSSQISELEEDIALYSSLRSGKVTTFKAEGLHELPDILIQARIARGMSQRDLADLLGIKEQQVQRYEAERYRSANLDRLIQVADALNVHIQKRAELIDSGRLEVSPPVDWRAFPVTEMYKRGWFEDFSGTRAQARKAASELVLGFLSSLPTQRAGFALHRKTMRAAGVVNEVAITAWEARIRRLAERDLPIELFSNARMSEEWLKGLVALTMDKDGPFKSVEYLRSIGISLVVERQLPGTLLDGAALLTANGRAIIGLTLRHDRLDNFWFTLMHELGHLQRHLSEAALFAIFDDTDAPAESEMEREADEFALETLLPAKNWKLAVSRYTRSAKAVLTDAKRFGVGPAIIAGRIRRETQNYTLLSELVGAGVVREQFGM